MDGIIRVNLPNFITIMLMAFVGVWILNKLFARFMPSMQAAPSNS